MKGNNTIELNYATVMEALQEYFDRRTHATGRFTVTSISPSGSGYDKCITVKVKAVESETMPDTASAA